MTTAVVTAAVGRCGAPAERSFLYRKLARTHACGDHADLARTRYKVGIKEAPAAEGDTCDAETVTQMWWRYNL